MSLTESAIRRAKHLELAEARSRASVRTMLAAAASALAGATHASGLGGESPGEPTEDAQ